MSDIPSKAAEDVPLPAPSNSEFPVLIEPMIQRDTSAESIQSDENQPLGLSKDSTKDEDRKKRTSSLRKNLPKTLDDPSPDCICNTIHDPIDLRKCSICKGGITAVYKIYQEKVHVSHELSRTYKKLQTCIIKLDESAQELLYERAKTVLLDGRALAASQELEVARQDLQIMGGKLTESVEKHVELHNQKQQIRDELEDLTQVLFEEANTMVSNEARQRHEQQQRVHDANQGDAIALQLAETNKNLLMEQQQLRELRKRHIELQQKHEIVLITLDNSLEISLPKPLISHDLLLFSHFKELVDAGPRVRFNKVHTFVFMRNALDDDVTPCLRFGGLAMTSAKRFIDAMLTNSCFIEEMDESDIKLLHDRDSKLTPTEAVPSVLERFTTAFTISEEAQVKGCSTCGAQEDYKHRVKISDVSKDIWCPVCERCRGRLLAVNDFYQFIRNLRQGMFSTRAIDDLYSEACELKREMFLQRLGEVGGERKILKMNSSVLHQ